MDEIQSEVLEVEGGQGAPETPVPEAPEADAPAGEEAGSDFTGELALNENGEIEISDSFIDSQLAELNQHPKSLDSLNKYDGTDKDQAQPQADLSKGLYTAEQLAKAFIENKVDPDMLPAGVKEYHDAIMKEHNQRLELQKLAQPPRQQQLIPPPPPPPQQPDLSAATFQVNQSNYRALKEGAQKLAAHYLGVNEIDEYNQEHANAVQMAMQEIKQEAEQKHRQNLAQQYQQQLAQYNQHANAYQQQQQQIRQQQYNQVAQEFSKHPQWKDIDQNFYPQWFASLDRNTQGAVQQVMRSGNLQNINRVIKTVCDLYDAQHPSLTSTQNKAQAKRTKAVVPKLMSSGNESDFSEMKGNVDVSKLEDLSPEARADWFIKNKFV